MSTHMGLNRTGIDMSPIDSKELIEFAEQYPPSSLGDEQAAAAVRADYAREAEPIGSVPLPGTLKGVVKSAAQMLKGNAPSVLINKLGERLAFERTGSRLYEGILAKFDANGSFPGGPTREDLVALHAEEVRHFEMVREAMERLGADPTAQTPCADVQGVAAIGLLQVISDPRTDLAQCLDALLVAELADNDGWRMLIDVVRAFRQDDLAAQLLVAQAEEDRHLELCRRWLSSYAILEARAAIDRAA